MKFNLIEHKKRFNKLRNEILIKDCFHSNQNCSKKIIRAHSIQENRILSALLRNKDDEILSFMNLEFNRNDTIDMKRIGKKKASTFSGFCGYHDNIIFKPIELKDYVQGNLEQEFIFAYRSLAWFYYSKRIEYNFYDKCYNILNKREENEIVKYFGSDFFEQEKLIEQLINNYNLCRVGALTTIKELSILKKAMNVNLDKQRYYKITTNVIVFDSESPIASSSIIYLEKDLKDNVINDYCGKEKLDPIFFNVFPQNGKTFILFSFLTKCKNKFAFIKDQIIEANEKDKKILCTNLILEYIENFYVSKTYWFSIDKSVRKKMIAIYNNSIGQINKNLLMEDDVNFFI